MADVALPNVELGDYSVPTDWPTNVRKNAPGDVPGAPVMFEDDDQSDIKAGYGFESDNLYEGDWFFFHTDHLGSTSYLTDTAGNVSQFVYYTPYGEAIVDEHLTTYENPFKFSGKELDDITGLYDHGARSRNPVSTLWYGVDPLFEKYPDFSPYNYCAGNPVVYVDPDGEAIVGHTEDDAEKFVDDSKLILSDDKFSKFRDLLTTNGNKINKIEKNAKEQALKDVSMTDSESKYIELLTNAINSREKHIVEYAGEYVSKKGTDQLVYGMFGDPHCQDPRASVVPNGEHEGTMHIEVLRSLGKTGITVSRLNGSYSVLDGSVKDRERAILSAHEVLGHGIALTVNSKNQILSNSNSMRAENLVRKIFKMPLDNGASHQGVVVEPFISPILKW